ncbi:AP2 domain-containing protein [Clostridium sp. AM22-11AC]|uniref:AP2 domain-containing protein n=1 Tax=Clostridium sp. AM22-11AC TaxID=2293024 RepID=UPI000E53ED57|nr:AP2 domain-containing protein [Clostridium sp. AM22-11AC]RHO08431.1 AP2 domain-containing protein [Clostridium sp. AM22-11AC]
MGKMIDLTGQRFGRLVVIERAGSRGGKATWLCQCDCGNQTVVIGGILRRGLTKSCGCLSKAINSEVHSTHHMTGERLHNIWRGMKARCYIESCSNYQYYGGRGIQICAEWKNDFTAFYNWALSHGYSDDLSIDRVNSNGNYEPENCRWVTMKKQFWNRRRWNTNKSGETGVIWSEDRKKWRAYITVNRKRINLGSFESKEDAVNARQVAEEKYWN